MKEDAVSELLRRLGVRKRSRMSADSELGFKKYAFKMLLGLCFILLDGIGVPSAFQALGLLSTGMAVPLGIAFVAIAAAELWVLSRIR